MPSLVSVNKDIAAERFIRSLNPAFWTNLRKHDGVEFVSDDAYGRLCTVTGALWTPRGRTFDGDDYIALPAFPLEGTVLTWEGWVRCTLNAGTQTLIGDGSQSTTVGYIWLIRDAGSNALSWQYANGAAATSVSALNYFAGLDGKWVYIAVVCDYTNKVTRFYRQGVQFGAGAAMTGTPVFPSTSRKRYLGAYSPASSRLTKGQIVTQRLHTRGLTDGGILNHFLLEKWRYQ